MKEGRYVENSVVNRIPPSMDKLSKRRSAGRYDRDENPPHVKRQKMDYELEGYSKLDPIVHAQRIETRFKMIQKGKNTVGYDTYSSQVPKHSRRVRSMDTPHTPDHTLDIPAKRWQGLVKAWYVFAVICRPLCWN
jgi:Histone RNA hairpin-binding protein RNA-binding domain